jgi:tRNA G10  N-methylase Trm11
MEPEIGFLMANLALASRRSHDAVKKQLALSCLDPCCGSGSLLLYSAALGATELVGVDSDPSVWEGAMGEFKRHTTIAGFIDTTRKASLPYPTFIEGDIFNPMMTREFDAIVCDPPYNIGTPIFVNKTDCRPKNYHRNREPVKLFVQEDMSTSDRGGVQNITLALLLLAGRVLVEGGRVVFFDPVRGSPTSSSVTSYEATMQSVGLTLVFERHQSFSPTFSRWLVCMEKCG